MEGFAIIDTETLPAAGDYPVSTCSVRGGVTARFGGPDDFSIWYVTGELDAGAEMNWATAHGDEVVYVLDGQLQVDGQDCGPRGVVLVESGVATTVRATEPTRIVHFGPTSPEPPTDGELGPARPDGHGVHVLGEHGVHHTERGPETPNEVYYADSTCPTCRVTLLRNSAPPDTRVASHTHSQDEIIFMLRGDVQMGRSSVVPGMGLAIRGHYRYGFTSDTGCEFLNFRRDVSLFTREPKSEPKLETIAAALAAGDKLEIIAPD
jgi:quercetin dioxygenase-like cupin family protein